MSLAKILQNSLPRAHEFLSIGKQPVRVESCNELGFWPCEDLLHGKSKPLLRFTLKEKKLRKLIGPRRPKPCPFFPGLCFSTLYQFQGPPAHCLSLLKPFQASIAFVASLSPLILSLLWSSAPAASSVSAAQLKWERWRVYSRGFSR